MATLRVKRELAGPEAVEQLIHTTARFIAHELERFPREAPLFVGIQRRGVPFARRVARLLKALGLPEPRFHAMEIRFYTDDLQLVSERPVVSLETPFSVDHHRVFLFDDVLFTGWTAFAALQSLFKLGTPHRVYFVTLVDRGHRAMPLCADFAALTVETTLQEVIHVHLQEVDQEDRILLLEKQEE